MRRLALTALLLLSLLTFIYLRPKGVEEDVPLEGSSEAIEAKLAGLEETST